MPRDDAQRPPHPDDPEFFDEELTDEESVTYFDESDETADSDDPIEHVAVDTADLVFPEDGEIDPEVVGRTFYRHAESHDPAFATAAEEDIIRASAHLRPDAPTAEGGLDRQPPGGTAERR